MKTCLFAFATIAVLSFSGFAQGTIGSILFSNRQIPTSAGDGTTYDIPIWSADANGTFGAGSLPGGVAVGLFLPNWDTPFIQNVLRNTTATQFFATPASQTVDVPGTEAGQTPTLVFRAWQNTGLTFGQALASGQIWAEITFTSRPLGGTPAGGGSPITPPGMNFSLDSSGVSLVFIPEPTSVALCVLGIGAVFVAQRRSTFLIGRSFANLLR